MPTSMKGSSKARATRGAPIVRAIKGLTGAKDILKGHPAPKRAGGRSRTRMGSGD